MTNLSRRTVLTSALATSLTLTLPAVATASPATRRLRELEHDFGGRLGVTAYRVGQGPVIDYRSGERFAICSTFKMLAAAAILRHARRCDPGLMDRVIHYRREDLVANSPITEQHVDTGMTVTALCDAAMRFSDNTAANLLLNQLDGPAGITRFARSLGDPHTRLDRYETDLNSNIPGDRRDTTTPADMAANLERLCLNRALARPDRTTLVNWMVGNTTGNERIRKGLPSDWRVGDRTGTGAYGAANDVAVAWPPDAPPLVIAVYTTGDEPTDEPNSTVIAEAARIVADTLYR